MRLANSADNYGLISKLFHWIMAALIIATYLLGKNLENNFEYYYEILMIHNTLGLSILVLAIFRLSWKFINIRPKPILKNKILIESINKRPNYWGESKPSDHSAFLSNKTLAYLLLHYNLVALCDGILAWQTKTNKKTAKTPKKAKHNLGFSRKTKK